MKQQAGGICPVYITWNKVNQYKNPCSLSAFRTVMCVMHQDDQACNICNKCHINPCWHGAILINVLRLSAHFNIQSNEIMAAVSVSYSFSQLFLPIRERETTDWSYRDEWGSSLEHASTPAPQCTAKYPCHWINTLVPLFPCPCHR